MAKVLAPFKIKGRVGNMTFFNKGGQNFIRPATFPKKLPDDYYAWHKPQYQNRFGFAGAVAAGSSLYIHAGTNFRQVARPHAANLIRGRIREMHKYSPNEWRIEFPVVHLALHGLDLGSEFGPSPILTTTLIGPSHQPTHLHLGNLRELASTVHDRCRIHGNAQLQMCIGIQWAPYFTQYFSHDGRLWLDEDRPTNIANYSTQSQWIPTHLLPHEGITLSARPQSGLPPRQEQFLFLLIEWREYRPVGEQIIPHHQQGIFRILTCQYPPERQPEIDRITAKRIADITPAPKNQDTANDLSEALKGML